MANWRGHGKGRAGGQPNPEFRGGAGHGGGRGGGQPRVPGEGGAGHGGGRPGGQAGVPGEGGTGHGGGRAGSQARVEGEGGAGHGGGRAGSQARVEGEGGPGHGGGRAGSQPQLQPRTDYGGSSTRFSGIEDNSGGNYRGGSSYKGTGGDTSARVADPEGAFCFALEIDGVEVAQFKECSGLKTTTEVFEIVEGGQNHRVHKLPGMSRWDNIRLRYGVSNDTSLLQWRNEILQDQFANRRNGSVVLKNNAMEEVRRFEFVQAWPVSWEGPALSADSSEIAIETLELAHHGITIS